ncbi:MULTISPECIES: RraA family protein [unclassified Pseudomonas]|uniref:RraA family protein n=1 Tax=unclassified Pseudomonas TaxID=196821 RepID=UPI0025D4D2E4|nr:MULTISPECIES: RraA family protein [unclassified Pseudomonas]
MSTATADLCDEHETAIHDGELAILAGDWRWFGQLRSLKGSVSTLAAAGCNYEIRQALAELGAGRILFIDAQGDKGACIGENLALLAQRNGWGGLIIKGNIRDASQLQHVPLGIVAQGTWPRRSENKEGGRRDVRLVLGNEHVSPGDIVCADEDGVVILRHP